jgi:hypothetical protein
MDQNNSRFIYLTNTFPRISAAQSKEGSFVLPQIRELIQDVKFEDQVNKVGEKTMDIIKNITTTFFLFGNHRVEKYRDMVAHLVQSYEAVG